ncbi:sporulation integral membrane protein YlbJ [Inediibacterium massiliense]|uniref:sporulation integral membrane protein YlbJ n=1 Tax=Inediibacterium massiliense TaxID=1658111 RepID=UPI0006B57849|nr:sporulation integral membrane protein YlbJ [Inediibacterium massiliense]
MNYKWRNFNFVFNIKKFFIIFIVSFLVFSIIKFPKESFEAAKLGIDTWFYIVFPALLPFFVGAELLISLGLVNFLGVLLEPLVRPLFNVPGEGSFILAMSVTSGYPMGVKLITQLRSNGICNKTEGQRLLSFCSTSGPLFMIGAVSIGMFKNPQLGTSIALSHYLGAIATGLLFRFYPFTIQRTSFRKKENTSIKKAFLDLFSTSNKNETTFGVLLGKAVKNSVETLLSIGGFIILFSVIIKLLNTLGILSYISYCIQSLLPIPKNICNAFIGGIFEMTVGCKALSEIPHLSFLQQALFSTILISFSGFSIHAQASSLISKTDLSISIYIFSKIIHAIFSGIFVVLTMPVIFLSLHHIHIPTFSSSKAIFFDLPWISRLIFSSELFLFILLIYILFALLTKILSFISIK